MLDMANSLRHDPEKPVFHVMPRHGWVMPVIAQHNDMT